MLVLLTANMIAECPRTDYNRFGGGGNMAGIAGTVLHIKPAFAKN
jgi:hypothetical protein